MSKRVHVILDKDSTVVYIGKAEQSLMMKFTTRNKDACWGHYYRAMKRRTDHPSVVLKSKRTGETLITSEIKL